MLIEEDDKIWLRESHPDLIVGESGVSGSVHFSATYDTAADYFVVVPAEMAGKVSGVVLSCDFRIRIARRGGKPLSELPGLFVEGVDPIMARHFDQNDDSACLCSPFEEQEFLEPAFRFRAFFENLVIPFLYAQEYFSRYGRWPWREYAHGVAGLLESFVWTNSEKTRRCLEKLASTAEWKQIRPVLQQQKVGGHTVCFCGKGDHFRRCHKSALEGLRRLHRAINEHNISLP